MLTGKPTYAHFPGHGPSGTTCGECAHHCSHQPMRNVGRGEQRVPAGNPVHWCAKAAEFAGLKPRGDKPPRGIGELHPASSACKYFAGGG